MHKYAQKISGDFIQAIDKTTSTYFLGRLWMVKSLNYIFNFKLKFKLNFIKLN